MPEHPTTDTVPLRWKLAALVAGAFGLLVAVTACWFGFTLLRIWLGLEE
jgi:hypothetical protein